MMSEVEKKGKRDTKSIPNERAKDERYADDSSQTKGNIIRICIKTLERKEEENEEEEKRKRK